MAKTECSINSRRLWEQNVTDGRTAEIFSELVARAVGTPAIRRADLSAKRADNLMRRQNVNFVSSVCCRINKVIYF